ncbi:MAG: hypothetical protein GY761_16755 [Hyphomicrobiales bacterium]|nr:hypothetical protein [Hyphomicrobiales bacterium]
MINHIINIVRHHTLMTCRPCGTGVAGRFARIYFSFLLLSVTLLIVSVSDSKAQYFGVLPSCSEATVHARIVKRFNQADRTLWHRGTRLKHIRQASERAYNIYPSSQINRRYCRGKAYMSNGRTRRVHFLIEQHMGLASFGWGVEYCLKGSDYWHAYGGWCRVLRKYR